MTSTSSDANIYTPDNGVAIGILATVGSDSYLVSISLAQDNDTGGTGNTDTPNYFYGTMARFEADKNGVGQSTTPLGSSVTQMGTSCLELSGGTSSTISSQSISAATGVVTISYNASTNIVTGYYNGTPVGSYSIASFGSNQLTLGVGGYSGEGVNVTAGTDTATNFFVDPFSGTVTATGLSKSPWFGHYSISSYPVVYQYNLGYEYVFPVNGGVGGVYLYDYTSGHFWYTQASYFPYLYDSSLNTFLYYYQANTPHRHFYDFGTGQVITL